MHSNIYKKFLYLLLFILVFFFINGGLNYLFLPAMNNTRIQVNELQNQQFQVISFGSSFSLHTFDPEASQRRLGMSTFNSGSHQTDIAHGMVAQFDNALSYQNPDIVILCVTPEDLEKSDKSEPLETYSRIAPFVNPFFAGIKYYVTSSLDQGALSRTFLWSGRINKYNTISSMYEDIRKNTYDKSSSGYRSYSIDWYNQQLKQLEMKYYLKPHGYIPMIPQDEPYNEAEEYSENITSEWKNDIMPIEDINKNVEDAFLYMFKICNKRNIQLVVTASPMAPLYIKGHSSYWDANNKMQSLIEANGGIYINLNLIKPEIWRPRFGDFWDEQHLVENAAYDYTYLLCDLIDKRMHEEDISDLFFSDFNDWTSSYNN